MIVCVVCTELVCGEVYALGTERGPFIGLLSLLDDRLTPIAVSTLPRFTLLGSKAKETGCVMKKQRARQNKTSLITHTHTCSGLNQIIPRQTCEPVISTI